MIQKHSKGPIQAFDLEKWRVKYGLTISAACELLGLQRAKWADLMKDSSAPIDDASVCILLGLYEEHPETMPIRRVMNVEKFMTDLGYDPGSPGDKKRFAGATGREAAATYRWLSGQGSVSKPVERLMEAVNRLPTESGKKKRQVLEGLAVDVAERMGVRDPLKRGSWRQED